MGFNRGGIAVAVFFACFAGTSAARAQAPPLDPPQVVVTGEASVKATPDQAYIQIGAESRSKVSKEAQARNAEVMTAVQQKVLSFGIAKEAIRTIAIDLQPEFDYQNGRQTPRGYVARNTIEVRVDELAKLGDVLDAAVASGAATIHALRFDVKNRSQVEQTALQQAVKAATAKAQAIASGANRAVDRILRIEEQFSGGPEPVMRSFAMAKAADAATPVAPGEIEIRAQVRLTAAIK
jgi:uncharacterized protein YggE